MLNIYIFYLYTTDQKSYLCIGNIKTNNTNKKKHKGTLHSTAVYTLIYIMYT